MTRYRIRNEHGEVVRFSSLFETWPANSRGVIDQPAMRHVPATATEPERWITWREAGYTIEAVEPAPGDAVQ